MSIRAAAAAGAWSAGRALLRSRPRDSAEGGQLQQAGSGEHPQRGLSPGA